MSTRPIFVLGTAYSGSRMLSWGLAQHPHLTQVLETNWLARLASDLQALHALSTVEPGASRLAETSTGPARFYETFGTAVSELFLSDESSHAPGAQAPRRWVDCTPGHVANIAGLLRLFPGARFIHLLRDVQSVVKALVRWPPPEGASYSEDAAYDHWLRTSKAILDAELAWGASTILRVRHADLFRQPERTLRTCLDFLEEPFCADCQGPFMGLDEDADTLALARCHIETSSPIRYEAELLSDLLLREGEPDTERIARLDGAFGPASDQPRVARGASSLIERVREAARRNLPPEAAVIVVSKGDAALLELGTRRASHFPQNPAGLYAGYHPATGAEAIEHLEDLRNQGHDFFLIPAPYFWWLEHYDDFAAHLHHTYRLVCLLEDTCLVFDLRAAPRAWSPPVRRIPPAGEPPPPAPPPSMARAAELAERLWGGFSADALPDLERVEQSRSAPASERIEAAWQQARWHAVEGDPAATLACLQRIAAIDGAERLSRRHLLLEVDVHLRLGHVGQARTLIGLGVARHGYDTDLCLSSSNAAMEPFQLGETAPGVDDERLAWINRIYTAHGLYPIRRADPSRPLTIDNLTTDVGASAPRHDGPRVSVIMPAYNAAATIGFALAGLREQTWRNLEILVVDDASTDTTTAVVAAAAALDDRITLIRQHENAGPYVARNAGLARATGAYVTVHDADDWSHAQKLETQITLLLEQPAVGSISHLARASQVLRFNGPWRPRDHLLEENLSSLMLRTDFMRDELGGWDPVRIGADAELKLRIEARDGRSALPRIQRDVPWSFALDETSSLTRHPATHVRTHYFGVRREYRRAYARWHAAASQTGAFRLDPSPGGPRRFPAPASILPERGPRREYDLLLIGDFAVSGEALESAHREVLAALTAGRRVGLFHWPRHDEPIDRPIEERIAALVDAGKVQGVAAGEEAAARHVAVHDPEACMHRIDRGPAIAFAALYVISRPSTESSYEPEIVKAHLESLFGSRGEWVSSIPAPPSNANPDYWEQRKHMMYYKYIDVLVRTLAAGARSLIDVGSKRTPLIEAFDWIPRRDALDIVQPYCSSHVRGIKADFLTYGPAERYDFALCLQVLEHIPDAAAFARHLFEVADNVLISVPFMWPEGATAHHVHDPVSLEKLIAWTGRTPSYDVVVAEPLGRSRLIAYFHAPHSTFSLKALREARA